MKRLLLSVFALGLMLIASSAMAANYGSAGCGLGALIFKDEPGKIQILVATINNLISPQTSAITSGTSNCYEDGGREEASLFIAVNREALKNDISRGNGETLSSLSALLGCSDTDQLGTTLRSNYQNIFPTSQASPDEINRAIGTTIRNDQELAKSCRIYG